jgi:hypothetical protein
MTIYNLSVITSTGFPFFYKKIRNLPEGIKLFQRFFDFTEDIDRSHEPLDNISSFELNAGLISALFEFAKNIDKKIITLEFKSLSNNNNKKSTPQKKYKGDALITAQTETYLLHRSVKQKIKLIYNNIISSKIPLETAEMLSDDEDQKIMDILHDLKARNQVFENQEKLKNLANRYIEDTGRYGLYNVVITSFDLSPISVFGEKYSFEEIEVILRNIGEIPHINPMKWKLRQSFINEKQVWIFLVNSGVGVTIEGLFEPYFYLLITDLKADLGESYIALTRELNLLLG